MLRALLSSIVLFALCACQSAPQVAAPRTKVRVVDHQTVDAALSGSFDNHEQVWSAREKATIGLPPHITVTIEPTAQADWSIWRIHLDAVPPLDAVWAMQRARDEALVPHRAATMLASFGAAFDVKQWASLDACALRKVTAASDTHAVTDIPACTALVPGLGAPAALLPLAVERDGEWMHVRFFADQARGTDARADLREVHVFTGWAAINGAGPNAPANNDWHMNRSLRLGSEGGHAALTWRDGKPSGYSLGLERLTYRDGNIPVLKLSVIDDASGQSLAYAWANPEASRIGVNLGWVQIGLERVSAQAVP